MKNGVRIVAGLILLVIPLLIPSGEGRDFAPVWSARYNGSGNGPDVAYALAVDSSGNVYVTGESVGSGTSEDYATIKYSTNGKQLWVKRYNGPGNGEDGASAIAVDGSGNVYVTGWSKGSGTDYDYATIKYNTNGNQLWTQRYNWPYNGRDCASAVAVDGAGNVYVTGWSVGSGTCEDYATIKYNTNGKQLWVKRYNGPANARDCASAIAVDGAGNVYVTGESVDSGTWDDYATIKYNANGKQLWVARYNGPGNYRDAPSAIAVDSSGNVYVTGYSYYSEFINSDYATIKYNANGKQLWVARYNGPGNNKDYANAIAVDGSGNVYVAGLSGWNVDAEMGGDYATIKYGGNGKQFWVKRYNAPAKGVDQANAIAVDGSGNVYVTGGSTGQGIDIYNYIYDYVTIKYGANGKQLWVKRYNGPGNDDDEASAIAVDASGNVYVTGKSWGSGTNYDYATIKY